VIPLILAAASLAAPAPLVRPASFAPGVYRGRWDNVILECHFHASGRFLAKVPPGERDFGEWQGTWRIAGGKVFVRISSLEEKLAPPWSYTTFELVVETGESPR
jgi:hypothetical protein